MSLNVFVKNDILPQKIAFFEPRQDCDTRFLLKIYYAVLFNAELSKEGCLSIDKAEVQGVLKISETTLENALFTLKKNGYLDLILLYLKLSKETYKLPKDLQPEFKAIQQEILKRKKEHSRETLQKMFFECPLKPKEMFVAMV